MFRFTIRELLLLTAIVAMGVAWWIDRSALASVAKRYKDAAVEADEKAFVLELVLHSTSCELDDQSVPGRIIVTHPNGEVRNWPARIKRPPPCQ